MSTSYIFINWCPHVWGVSCPCPMFVYVLFRMKGLLDCQNAERTKKKKPTVMKERDLLYFNGRMLKQKTFQN